MKNKFGWTVLGMVILTIGCARVQVEAPKDPIKMDITMRLDVYQHVAKDIDDIESIVSGHSAKSAIADAVIPSAHAADLSPEVEQAAFRRRDRLNELNTLKAQGALKELPSALVGSGSSSNPSASQIMNDENADRMIIYRAIAKKNGSSVEDVQKIYAERLKG